MSVAIPKNGLDDHYFMYPATAWRALEIDVVPGISAMFAAAARIGAPLGHDLVVVLDVPGDVSGLNGRGRLKT